MTQDLAALVAALRTQRQIDMDGCEVAVSRQACDEAADALEAQSDEIARLTGLLEHGLKECARETVRAEKAEAALSECQALLAMWPEVAANITVDMGPRYDGRPVHYHIPENVKLAIRALTSADAQAALDARINAAREEGWVMGLREAGAVASAVSYDGDYVAERILAKIKEADHE